MLPGDRVGSDRVTRNSIVGSIFSLGVPTLPKRFFYKFLHKTLQNPALRAGTRRNYRPVG